MRVFRRSSQSKNGFPPMNELDYLDQILDEMSTIRQIVYCCGLYVVLLLGYLSGRK